MDKCLFNEKITDHDSWEKCGKANAFMPLLKYIYESNHIKPDEIIPIPEVTGVFQMGDTITKLFYPPETKLEYAGFYKTELTAMQFCKNAGVLTPDIICTGIIRDNLYSFPYIMMVNIDGVEAGKVTSGYNKSEKIGFSLKLKEIAEKIHIPANIDIPHYNDASKIDSKLWNIMPEPFREDRKRYLANVRLPDPVFQHGDLWDRNIIIDKRGRLNLIDFSESLIAPSYYDLGPMILNNGRDPVRLEAYWGDYKNDDFYDKLTTAWLLNWFGAVFIDWRAKDLDIETKSMTSVEALKNLVIKMLII
jgi:hypothetical protein